jgi:hypothetical protein
VRAPGRATTFWATDKLVRLAEHFGVHLEDILKHFKPEPPPNPLVLRGPGSGKGINGERGPIIKRYKHTETTRRLEAEVRELNDFPARCDIRGGEHHGFTRNRYHQAHERERRLSGFRQRERTVFADDFGRTPRPGENRGGVLVSGDSCCHS